MDELLVNYQENELKIKEYEGKINLAIVKLKEEQEELQNKNEEIKEKIKQAMEEQDIKKYENDILAITYIAPTKRKTVDTTKLKEQYEEAYLDCLKETDVKSSIRIKVK